MELDLIYVSDRTETGKRALSGRPDSRNYRRIRGRGNALNQVVETVEMWSWIDLGCVLQVEVTGTADNLPQEHLFLLIISVSHKN